MSTLVLPDPNSFWYERRAAAASRVDVEIPGLVASLRLVDINYVGVVVDSERPLTVGHVRDARFHVGGRAYNISTRVVFCNRHPSKGDGCTLGLEFRRLGRRDDVERLMHAVALDAAPAVA